MVTLVGTNIIGSIIGYTIVAAKGDPVEDVLVLKLRRFDDECGELIIDAPDSVVFMTPEEETFVW